MLDPTEAGLLRAIAQDHAENTPRLAYADWLDENGDAPRAAFIRVQCELAADVSDERRAELRQRERELLSEHLTTWFQAFGLPLEDVEFERGLIDKMRLSKWDSKFLDPAFAPRFATLTELDLSGLELGDAEIAAFAKASLPALRKLILSNNRITDSGAGSLEAATGYPQLNTVYLFGNTISGDGEGHLATSPNFSLHVLDLGVPEEGYSMSPGQTDVTRRIFVRTQLLPVVRKYFEQYPRLQSAALCVAQYWNDEADDAVHAQLVVSEFDEPSLKCREFSDDPDPNVPSTFIKSDYSEQSCSIISLWDNGIRWSSNNGAIPLWAAFAPEHGSQEYERLEDVYLPAVMFHRHGGYEILPMTRPHLDGIRPEWEAGD